MSIVKDADKYRGEWVCIVDNDGNVVSHGVKAVDTYNEAIAQGAKNPVLVYIQEDKDIVQVPSVWVDDGVDYNVTVKYIPLEGC